ncbi:MAG: STAS domain-containing protein, partial [Acidimicrobiia bacterium]|nr:STAS domain-containing protein [Acidimicrobiia bacterium]
MLRTTDGLTLSEHDGFKVARLDGEIDVANAIELETELTWAIPNTALGLIVDLSEVSFIDSTGIRCLFDLAMRLDGRQQDLRLVLGRGTNLYRTLTLVQLHTVVPIFDDVAAAVAGELLSAGREGEPSGHPRRVTRAG